MGLISKKISTKAPIRYKPETKEELRNIIVDLLKKGITDLNCIDVTNITDMRFVFYSVNTIVEVKDIDISEWDVSNVTNMIHMFDSCEAFNSDLSNWDVSKVKNMYDMFRGCKEFNSDLSHWNVSNVTDMEYMFVNCHKFNADLSKWKLSKIKFMTRAFYGCNSLTKIPDWYNGTN